MEWLNQNAGAVQAISTAAIVLLTLVLVGATIWYVKQTSDIARATRENAAEQARVADLLRRDLETRVAPFLRYVPLSGPSPMTKGKIQNSGPGAALWIRTKVTFLPSGREVGIHSQDYLPVDEEASVELARETDEGDYMIEIRCTDSAAMKSYYFRWSSAGKLEIYLSGEPGTDLVEQNITTS